MANHYQVNLGPEAQMSKLSESDNCNAHNYGK